MSKTLNQADVLQMLRTLVKCLRRLPDSLDEKRTALPIAERFLEDAERHASPTPNQGFDKTADFKKTGTPEPATVVVKREPTPADLEIADQLGVEVVKDAPGVVEDIAKDGEE